MSFRKFHDQLLRFILIVDEGKTKQNKPHEFILHNSYPPSNLNLNSYYKCYDLLINLLDACVQFEIAKIVPETQKVYHKNLQENQNHHKHLTTV